MKMRWEGINQIVSLVAGVPGSDIALQISHKLNNNQSAVAGSNVLEAYVGKIICTRDIVPSGKLSVSLFSGFSVENRELFLH